MTINARQNLRQRSTGDEYRPAQNQTARESDSRPRFATVSIPDVRGLDFQALDQPESTRRSSKPSSRQPLDSGDVRNRPTSRSTQNAVQPGLEAIRNSIEKSGCSYEMGRRNLTAIPNHSEQPIRSSQTTDADQSNSGGTTAWLDAVDGNELQIQPLVQSILDHCPGCGTSTIMLAGTENNPQLGVTAAKAAVALQSKTAGRVLLIDSDTMVDGLTRQFGCRDFVGLTDLFQGTLGPQQTIRSTSYPKIDFLPAGTVAWSAADKVKAILKKTLPQLADHYDLILVNAGDAHGAPAASWTPFVIGTWLMVSLTGSNRIVARSAVSQLNDCGARLLGCIVSECTSWNR